MNLDWFKYWSSICPHKIACHTLDDDKTYTYQHINETALKWTSYFQVVYKLKPGSRICILAENCIENIYLFGVAQKLGIILIPLNYRLSQTEINGLVQDAKPALILYDKKFSGIIADCKISIETLTLKEIPQKVNEGNHKFLSVNIKMEDPLFILYTSGSTGVPKGAIYTHKMLFWNSVNTAVSLHLSSDTTTLNVMPPFHTGGWNVLLTPVFHHGGRVLLLKKFESDRILQYLEKHSCNQFMAVPTMLKLLSEDNLFAKTDLSKLPYIIVGGESMPLKLIEVYKQKGIDIRQGYGMTEVGPNLTSLHQDYVIDKQGSIGKANMYIDVKLINEQGEIIKTGERGELCFSGNCVTPGYWNRPDATQEAIRNGWFHSGDIATQDEDGFLYIVDRIKNMFISGGENVYPAEIEKVLLAHTNIEEAVVIGVQDAKWGEVGKAFIVSSIHLSESEIKTFCLESLSKYKIPKYFRFVEEIPKLTNGKIDRKRIEKLDR